jgi:periplasmic divalent cation tolerance protein
VKYCVVFVTVPNRREAKKLANIALKEKLCACANIVGGLESFFWWEGKIDSAKELLVIFKTTKTLLPELIKTIKMHHSYKVCEIIALPIIKGSKPYLDWISASCRRPKR